MRRRDPATMAGAMMGAAQLQMKKRRETEKQPMRMLRGRVAQVGHEASGRLLSPQEAQEEDAAQLIGSYARAKSTRKLLRGLKTVIDDGNLDRLTTLDHKAPKITQKRLQDKSWAKLDGHAQRAYDMTQPLRVMTKLRGTIFEIVLKRVEIYLFFALHTSLLVLNRMYPELGLDWLGTIITPSIEASVTLFTIFLLTYFNDQCYTRYCRFYSHCREIEKAVHMVASNAGIHIDNEVERFAACRFALASAMISLMRAIPGDHDSTDYQLDANEWDRLLFSEVEWLNKQKDVYELEKAPPMRFVVARHAVLENKLHSVHCAAVLTEDEKAQLECYPSKNLPLVLHMWALKACRLGLMGEEEEGGGRERRMERARGRELMSTRHARGRLRGTMHPSSSTLCSSRSIDYTRRTRPSRMSAIIRCPSHTSMRWSS